MLSFSSHSLPLLVNQRSITDLYGLLSLLPLGVAFLAGLIHLFLERLFLVSLCGFHLRSSYVPLVFGFPKVFAIKSNLHPLIIVIAILNLS